MVRDPKTMQIKSMLLFCDVCKTHTKHVLDRSGKHLVCGCGTQVVYHISLPVLKGQTK